MKKRHWLRLGCVMVIVVLTAVLSGNVFAAPEQSYTFGVKDPKDAAYMMNPLPALKEQGTNNFYYMYSKEHNVDGKIKISSLKECVKSKHENSYGMAFFQPLDADVDYYPDVEWPKLYPDKLDKKDKQFWWRIDQHGETSPAGNMTAVIAFKAPADAGYEFVSEYYGGAKLYEGQVMKEADGVSFAILKGDGTPLFSKNTKQTYVKRDAPAAAPKQSLKLKKGEFVYFVCDPNASYEWDEGHWYIQVSQSGGGSAVSSAVSSGKTPSSAQLPSGPNGTGSKPSPESKASGTESTPSDAGTFSEPTAESSEGDGALSSASSDDPADSSAGSKDDNEKKGGFPVALAVVGGIVVLAGAAVCVYLFVIRKK